MTSPLLRSWKINIFCDFWSSGFYSHFHSDRESFPINKNGIHSAGEVGLDWKCKDIPCYFPSSVLGSVNLIWIRQLLLRPRPKNVTNDVTHKAVNNLMCLDYIYLIISNALINSECSRFMIIFRPHKGHKKVRSGRYYIQNNWTNHFFLHGQFLLAFSKLLWAILGPKSPFF